MIGGGARDIVSVIGVEYSHVRSGVGGPVNGVEKSRVVGVEDGVDAAFVMDIEGSEGFSRSEHRGSGISGKVDCEVWSVGLQKFLK